MWILLFSFLCLFFSPLPLSWSIGDFLHTLPRMIGSNRAIDISLTGESLPRDRHGMAWGWMSQEGWAPTHQTSQRKDGEQEDGACAAAQMFFSSPP
jgi:hypothetical protein